MKTRNLDAIIELARRDPTVNSAANLARLQIERWGGEPHIPDLQAYAEALELAVVALVAGNGALSKSLLEIHQRTVLRALP